MPIACAVIVAPSQPCGIGTLTTPVTFAAGRIHSSHDIASGLSDVGLKHKVNEDHFVIAALQRSADVRQTSLPDPRVFDVLRGPEALVFLVADGVGGRPGGALASETAVTALMEYIGRAAGPIHQLDVDREHEFLGQLEAAVHEAHDRVVAQSGGKGQGPATTLTMATLVWPRVYLVHVGDSRAFYLHKGRLKQLTRDQTTGEYMVDAGAWTEEQAAKVSFCTPEELLPYLDSVEAEALSAQRTVRGYKVKVRFKPAKLEEREAKRGAVSGVIAKAMKRMKQGKK